MFQRQLNQVKEDTSKKFTGNVPVEKTDIAKRLLENRKKLYGDSEKNMNTDISNRLKQRYDDLSKDNSDDER